MYIKRLYTAVIYIQTSKQASSRSPRDSRINIPLQCYADNQTPSTTPSNALQPHKLPTHEISDANAQQYQTVPAVTAPEP